MLDFFNLKPEAFGLDISDLSLKIVKLEKQKNGFTLASFGETKFKPGIIRKGKVKSEKELIKIIKKTINEVRGKKLKTNYVVTSLPEEKSFLQVIQMPRMAEEDLTSAVVYEAENYIPLPIEEVYLDSQIVIPISNHLDHYDVLISALPKNLVDPYVSCLKSAGLRPVALELDSLAITRALIKDESTTQPVILIDFGETKATFIIFSGRAVRFTSSVSISSHGFTEAISSAMKIDLKKAEDLKIKYGIKASAIYDIVAPLLNNLIEEIKKYINYYQTHTSHEHLSPADDKKADKKIEKIILCGGGSNLKGLIDFISKQLNISVEFGNPQINLLPEDKKTKDKLPAEKLLSYTAAIGLALRGIKEKSRFKDS